MARYDSLLEVPAVLATQPEQALPNDEQMQGDLELLDLQFARYADVVTPLLDRIDATEQQQGDITTLPGHVVSAQEYHCFALQDREGNEIVVRTVRPETAYSKQERLLHLTAPLLLGRGNEQLERLEAVNLQRQAYVTTAPAGKPLTALGVRDIARIKADHIEQLTLTLNYMRQHDLHPRFVDGVHFDPDRGFSFRDYGRMSTDFFIDPRIMTNTVTFLHWALADHKKLRDLSEAKSMGAPIRPEAFRTTGLRAAIRAMKLRTAADQHWNSGPAPHYYDTVQPLPPYDEPAELITIDNLRDTPAPAGASRYVRTSVHTVRRANGNTGFQVVNDLNAGVSLLAIDVVLGHAYGVFVDQIRYPHTRPGQEYLSLETAARQRRIGRWSREIISGGVETGETLKEALVREAAEEAGIMGMDPDGIERLFPELKVAVGINNQPFNLFAGKIGEGMWNPELAFPDSDEGEMPVGAYRMDTVVPEMIRHGMIFEMSAVLAIKGLYNSRYRRYL